MEKTYRQPQRVMHTLKFRTLEVKNISSLTPKTKRVLFTSPDLSDFVSGSPDDHIKLFFPKPGESTIAQPVLGPEGPLIPEGTIMRDYTPLRYDNGKQELEIEFFLHEDGPATNWAKHAQVGFKIGAGGPRGSMIVPYDFDWYLMIGDESAIPSFSRRLKELPASAKALLFIETSSELEKREFLSDAKFEVHWVFRENQEAGSDELLKNAILKKSFPHGDYFTWISTELECSKKLRELLETVRGANSEWIKATGYWRKNMPTK